MAVPFFHTVTLLIYYYQEDNVYLDMWFKTDVLENADIVFLMVPFQEAYENCSTLVGQKECNHATMHFERNMARVHT